MSTDTRIEALHAGLGALRVAVDGEEHALAGQLMTAHAAQLRDYIDATGPQADLAALQELLQAQNALNATMADLRDHAAAQLKQGRRSNRAALAYLRAESLS
ncbi:MAG: hypothetical protein ABW278_10100 [Steroidobacteraceae bacterium]